MATTSKLAIAANVDTNGAIDADGHVLDTLADYLEDKYKGRALKLTVGDDGLEYFLWDNKIPRLCSGGFAGVLGGMGDPDILPSPERDYERGCPPASYDAAARVERLDGEGLTSSDLFYVESSSRRRPRAGTIVAAPRVGIAYAEEWQNEPLRFFVAGNLHVSHGRG